MKNLGVDMLPDVEGADESVAKVIAGLPKLKSLVLGVKLVNDDFMETLSQYKNPFSRIKKLYLGGMREGRKRCEEGKVKDGKLLSSCSLILIQQIQLLTLGV